VNSSSKSSDIFPHSKSLINYGTSCNCAKKDISLKSNTFILSKSNFILTIVLSPKQVLQKSIFLHTKNGFLIDGLSNLVKFFIDPW